MHNRIIHDIVSVAGVPWLFDLVSILDPKRALVVNLSVCLCCRHTLIITTFLCRRALAV
jgi:hypothetical protein